MTARGLVVEHFEDLGPIRQTVLAMSLFKLDLEISRVRVQHDPVDRIDAVVHDHLVAVGDPQGHHHGLVQGGAAVVERGVRHLHLGEPADRRLKLVDRLERPLRDFRLVRRVRGVELAASDDRIDRRRDEMIVEPAAQEERQVNRVLARQIGHAIPDFLLAQAVRQLERLGHQLRRNVAEEIVHRQADRRKHLLALLGCVGNKLHIDAFTKPEIRNSNFEIRNKSKSRKLK